LKIRQKYRIFSHVLCELALFLENMGVLRGYTLIIYKEVSYFFMLLFMMIFFAASEIKVEEINALCKQTSACGDSLSSSPQADVLFYFIC